MTKKSFIYIISKETKIQVNPPTEIINGQKIRFPWLPILWNRNGLFRIVPVGVLKNKMESITVEMGSHRIHWDEAIPVDQTFARLLLGEDIKGKCTYIKN